jgi:hypothetical protein
MRRAALPLLVAAPVLAVVVAGTGQGAAPPQPERGVAVVVEPVRGTVQVHGPGTHRYDALTAARRVPVGSTIDAKEGAVRLTIAAGDDGETSSAVFSEGKFTVTQPRTGKPTASLRLTGPRFADVCGTQASTAAHRKKRRRVRRLWGDGHGSFRTVGQYSAGTVRGTRWLTEDRCDGTLTKVVRGTVEVEDFTQEEPTPAPPTTGGGEGGGGNEPPSAPEPTEGAGDGGGVPVSAGNSYVARP